MAWADAAARDRDGVRVVADPREAATGAKAVYTDVWVSMGDEESAWHELEALASYQVSTELMALAVILMGSPCTAFPRTTARRSRARFAHGPRSAIWDEAENRLHAQAALLAIVLARE